MDNFWDLIIDTEEYFEKIKGYKNIFLYGAGTKGKQTLKILREKGINPVAFIDRSASKLEYQTCDGIKIINYEEVKASYNSYCILITTVWTYAIEILNELADEKNPIYICANPFKMENKLYDRGEIEKDTQNLTSTYNLLEDQLSKNILIGFTNWKITGDSNQNGKYTEVDSELEWFSSDILPKRDDYVYVDIGAYTGDTVVRFLAFCGWKYKKIIAIEPDSVNLDVMSKCLEYLRINDKKLEIKDIGVWSETTELKFYKSGMNAYESSNFIQECSNTISKERQSKGDKGEYEILKVDTLDNLLNGESEPMLLKIDVQGVEYETLLGAENIIKKRKPSIIMEFGTYSKHIADIVPLLKLWNSEYKFYLRQIKLSGNSRTVLFVI